MELVPRSVGTSLEEAVAILTRAELKAMSGETRSYVSSAMHVTREATFLRPKHCCLLLRSAHSMIDHANEVEVAHRRGDLKLKRAMEVIASAVVELESMGRPDLLRAA